MIVTQVRGRRTSFDSSTGDHDCSSGATLGAAGQQAAQERLGGGSIESCCRSGRGTRPPASGAPGPARRMRTPWVTSRLFTDSAGSPFRWTRRCVWSSHSTGIRRARRNSAATGASGDSMRTTPVGASRRPPVLRHEAAVGHHRRAGADQLHLGQEVAGQEDGRALADQVHEERAQLVDALRVEAVGGLVEDEQARAAQQRGGQARGVAACPSSRPAPDAGPRRPGRRAPAHRRCAPPGARAPFLPAASNSVRFRRPDRCG